MCLFCDCDNSRKWRQNVDLKLEAILGGIASMLTPSQRAAIQEVTDQLKANTTAAKAAIAANNPSKVPPKGETK